MRPPLNQSNSIASHPPSILLATPYALPGHLSALAIQLSLVPACWRSPPLAHPGSANDIAKEGGRTTVNAADVLHAMRDLEFDEFITPVEASLAAFRETEKARSIEAAAKRAAAQTRAEQEGEGEGADDGDGADEEAGAE